MNKEPCIAHRVRQWLLAETSKRGEFSFTSNEAIKASGLRAKPTSATLSKLRKQGFLTAEGKRRRKGQFGRAEVQYRITPEMARAFADIPVRREPEPHTRVVQAARKVHKFEKLPTIEPSIADELLRIAIAFEENGSSRPLGLHLLKLVLRIFERGEEK